MDVGAVSNNSLDIQSLLINGVNGLNRNDNENNKTNQTAEYAKKGEPMYMADMDTDGDGTVTLDEFREYCKSKGMSTKSMVQMSQLASSYRTMKAENEVFDYISKLIPNVHPNLKQPDSQSPYQNQGENKLHTDNLKVSYDDYISYCEQNASPYELKSNTTYEESEDGLLNVKNSGKAINAYAKSEESNHKSMIEKVV